MWLRQLRSLRLGLSSPRLTRPDHPIARARSSAATTKEYKQGNLRCPFRNHRQLCYGGEKPASPKDAHAMERVGELYPERTFLLLLLTMMLTCQLG